MPELKYSAPRAHSLHGDAHLSYLCAHRLHIQTSAMPHHLLNHPTKTNEYQSSPEDERRMPIAQQFDCWAIEQSQSRVRRTTPKPQIIHHKKPRKIYSTGAQFSLKNYSGSATHPVQGNFSQIPSYICQPSLVLARVMLSSAFISFVRT